MGGRWWESSRGPPSGGSPAPRVPAGPRRGRIPGDRRRPWCDAQGETMLSVPEFYSKRRQFDGQSSTRLDVSAAWSHFLGAGDRKAVPTGTCYTVSRCSRHRGSPAGFNGEAGAAIFLVLCSALGLVHRRIVAFILRPRFSRIVGHICFQIQKQRGVLSELNSVWPPTQMCRE